MKVKIGLLMLGVCLLFPLPVAAQPPDGWLIPQIECSENCTRQDRVDEAGNLYFYVRRYDPPSQILYVIRRNSNVATGYDIASIYRGRGIRPDYVPFADGKLVLAEYQVPDPVTLIDLRTGQASTLDVPFPVIPCNQDMMLYLGPHLFRVGENGVLFCSYHDDSAYLELTRFENDTLHWEASLAMGPNLGLEGDSRMPWRVLAGGQDGKIYAVFDPDAAILSQVAPQYAHYDWSDYLVGRFDPVTQSWETIFIEVSAERCNEMVTYTSSLLVGVDAAGNLYFENRCGQTVTDFVKYDSQGWKVWHLTEADFGGRAFVPLLVSENQFILSFRGPGIYDRFDQYFVQEENADLLAP
jgi:hypothetical protein